MSQITHHFPNIEAVAVWMDGRAEERQYSADHAGTRRAGAAATGEANTFRLCAQVLRESVIGGLSERDAELLRRFREAGWEIAVDGDPYRPSEVPAV
jgi:hypothetical protein